MTRSTDRDEGKEPFVVGKGEVIRETDRALLVDLRGEPDELGGTTSRELWIPKSVIHDNSEIYGAEVDGRGRSGKLVVFRWFAVKERLKGEDDER